MQGRLNEELPVTWQCKLLRPTPSLPSYNGIDISRFHIWFCSTYYKTYFGLPSKPTNPFLPSSLATWSGEKEEEELRGGEEDCFLVQWMMPTQFDLVSILQNGTDESAGYISSSDTNIIKYFYSDWLHLLGIVKKKLFSLNLNRVPLKIWQH